MTGWARQEVEAAKIQRRYVRRLGKRSSFRRNVEI